VRLAAELEQPPFALYESGHPGPLPQRRSFASDGGGDVVLTVLKGAEDEDGSLVVRAYETSGRASRATIELPLVSRSLTADFRPHELKTFRVPRDASAPVSETTLLEWQR
jgi:alpha-mannosidase